MDKLKMMSMDRTSENIEKIRAIFPNCVTEVLRDGKEEYAIDFDMLRQELSKDIVEGREERYQMTWPDKKKAILLANSQITKTLRPCREESVDFDNTENLYIEGDNLEVLKLLQETYLGKVKMIYIDPPYNTGNDSFVYNDIYSMDEEDFKKAGGYYDEEGNRVIDVKENSESNGRFHTDWLNMIYPRLKIARDLLSDDGIIFISISDVEQANLKKVCDELFGEDNFIGSIARVAKKGGNKGDIIKPKKDIVQAYAKNLQYLRTIEFGKNKEKRDYDWLIDSLDNRKYVLGEVPYRAKLESRPNQRYYIECPDGSLIIPQGDVFPNVKADAEMVKPLSNNDKCWTWSKERYLKEKENNRFYFYKTNNSPFLNEKGEQSIWGIRKKIFQEEIQEDNSQKDVLSDLLEDYSNALGTKELDELRVPFSYPKPTQLIKYFLERVASSDDSLILDFFSGSATTAHAVMQLNAEDGGNRKFIMVQLPEACDEKSEAYKAGYKNICEIGKERIRRAGKKIKEENPLTTANLDTGFRVLKLDSSNMRDVFYKPEELTQMSMLDTQDNIKPDRSAEDVLFQVMLDMGTPLSAKIEQNTVCGKQVFTVADNYLMACFEDNLAEDVITAIAKQQPLYAVFRDSSFATDSVAKNVEQIFATYSPDTKLSIL